MSIPNELVECIKKGECILFLGAMASAPSPEESPYKYEDVPPSGAELSKILAEKSGYPDQDINNLQRVSLFFEYREGGSRNSLVKSINEEIAKPNIKPSPALDMLAALPFRIMITTNYDRLLERALSKVEIRDGVYKDPIVKIYDPTKNGPIEDFLEDPTEQRPFLFKIHGDIDKPESIVVTEEDYITFIQRMSSKTYYPIPETIHFRLKRWPTLFIGYSLKDYNLRLLLRTLREYEDQAYIPLSYSVNPNPDDLIVLVLQEMDKGKIKVHFIKENLWDFVPELYKGCKGEEYKP